MRKQFPAWLIYVVGYALIPRQGLTGWNHSILRVLAAMIIFEAGQWLQRIRCGKKELEVRRG